MQINVDEDAYRILKETRDKMIASGIRASFSDAVRLLDLAVRAGKQTTIDDFGGKKNEIQGSDRRREAAGSAQSN